MRRRSAEEDSILDGDGVQPMVCAGEIGGRYTRGMVKRGYSREFTPKTDRRVMLTIDRIPPTLYEAAKTKAKRDGISLRALVLGWLKEWVNEHD